MGRFSKNRVLDRNDIISFYRNHGNDGDIQIALELMGYQTPLDENERKAFQQTIEEEMVVRTKPGDSLYNSLKGTLLKKEREREKLLLRLIELFEISIGK